MIRSLMSVLTAVQLMLSGLSGPQLTMTALFKTGEMLRFHVVAQDDTEEMQRVKMCVRDAVQRCYHENRARAEGTMQEKTAALLPELTRAAIDCARAEGFEGSVRVELGDFRFDERPLASISLPEGEYPALMVFLGEAQGHNWWGLMDPQAALMLASVPGGSQDGLTWDWSLEALIAALFGLYPAGEEGNACGIR